MVEVGQPVGHVGDRTVQVHEFGMEESDLGRIAVAQRTNALRHGRTQLARPLSAADYLASPDGNWSHHH